MAELLYPLTIDPKKINGKTILITGGTGSFGHQMVKTLVTNFQPKKIIIFSRDEYKQAIMKARFNSPEYNCLRFLIGDVRDLERLDFAFKNVDLVFHASALKRITECEYNPMEAIKTNILGTNNVVTAAIRNHVSHVIGISTDKACSPVNLYGGTKLCAEKILLNGNILSDKTIFAVLRYGNVLGSRGSAIEIFHKLTQQNNPITITDPEMTRFTITLQEAINFVLFCYDICQGGEIFIPILPSYNIIQLAKLFQPDESSYKFIGIRKGEKLHELMVSADESSMAHRFSNFIILTPLEEYNLQHYKLDAFREDFVSFKHNEPYCSGENYLIDNDRLKTLINECLANKL